MINLAKNTLKMFRKGSEKSHTIFMDFTGRVHDEGDKGDMQIVSHFFSFIFFLLLAILFSRPGGTTVSFSFIFIINEHFSRLTTYKRTTYSKVMWAFWVMLTMKRVSTPGWIWMAAVGWCKRNRDSWIVLAIPTLRHVCDCFREFIFEWNLYSMLQQHYITWYQQTSSSHDAWATIRTCA